MKRWCRTAWILAAASGVALAASVARAQDYRPIQTYQTPRLYPNTYTDSYQGGLIKPQPRQAPASPTGVWDSPAPRLAQIEPRLAPESDDRVSQLETEIAALKQRLDAPSAPIYDPSGGYVDGDCGCETGCCQYCPPGRTGWYVGAELLFLKPHFDDSTAFLSSPSGEIANRTFAECHSFDYDYGTAPRIFFGYTSPCGLGFRTSYFQFDHTSNTPYYAIPAGGDAETPAIQPYLGSGDHFFMDDGGASAFQAQSALQLQTWDLEATSQVDYCQSTALFGAGLRLMNMEQRYTATSVHPNGHAQEVLRNEHDFYGVGPTLSLNYLRTIKCCSGLSWYANGRGSVLFGQSNQYYQKAFGGTNVSESYTCNGADNSVYIAEVAMGLQYQRGIFFARTGWEGQYWAGVGGPTTNTGDLGLFGFSIASGLNW